jgi:DNA-binding NarL/FixJ family response regulator
VLLLSVHDNEQYFFEALVAGASGYVLKSAADRDLILACRATMRGEPFLYPGTEKTLVREYLEQGVKGEARLGLGLTPRETEVIKLVAEGFSNRQIAKELVISEKTVQRHRANIMEKLGLHDRVGLTRYAIRCGLVEP